MDEKYCRVVSIRQSVFLDSADGFVDYILHPTDIISSSLGRYAIMAVLSLQKYYIFNVSTVSYYYYIMISII